MSAASSFRRSFQSTLPMRGATGQLSDETAEGWRFQSTLPMRGATSVRSVSGSPVIFQSTLPMRGATRTAMCNGVDVT